MSDEEFDPDVLAAIEASKKELDPDPDVAAALAASMSEVSGQEENCSLSWDQAQNSSFANTTGGTLQQNGDDGENRSFENSPASNTDAPDLLDPLNNQLEDKPEEACVETSAPDHLEPTDDPLPEENPLLDIDEKNVTDQSDGDCTEGTSQSFIEKINSSSNQEPDTEPDQPKEYFKKKRANSAATIAEGQTTVKRVKCEEDVDIQNNSEKSEVEVKKESPVKLENEVKSERDCSKIEDRIFSCSSTNHTFDTLGELVLHRFENLDSKTKPSYLDIAENVLVRLAQESGSSKTDIYECMMRDYSKYVVESPTESKQLLSRALTGGVPIGRLREKKPSSKNGELFYSLSSLKDRRKVRDRWKKDERSVEYKDVKSIAKGSKEFLEIQAKLNKFNLSLYGIPESHSRKSENKESDEDIEVLDEKITEKAKLRAEHRKKLIAQRRAQKLAASKTVIRVNSDKGKQLLRKIVATGSVPSQSAKIKSKSAYKYQKGDDSDEDLLSCSICMSSFWYPNQTFEHMKSVHNVDNPEKFLKQKTKLNAKKR